MSDFERWQERHNKDWATKDHLKRLVALDILTPQEYEQIAGEPHEA